MITKRQKEVLEFVKIYQKKMGYAPSLEEIKQGFNFASVSTAHFHIKKLEIGGYLIKSQNHPRSISVFGETRTVEVPLLGVIAAGLPIEAIEFGNQNIIVSKSDLHPPYKHFALKVSGESMIEDGIFDGDVVIIREQAYADDGQTVVAIIDENQATLKKIYKEKDRIRLQPANQNLLPLYRKEVEIRGVVEKIIRNLNRFDSQIANPTPKGAGVVQIKEHLGISVSGETEINNVYNTDCLDLMTDIKSNSINLIFADPPYNLSKSNFKMKFSKSGGKDLSTNKGKWDLYSDSEFEEFTKKWLSESYRILKDGGTIWVAGSYHNIYLSGYLMRKIGFEILGEVLWHKSDATPNLSCTRFVADHENFIWARKGRGNIFNYDLMKELNGGKQMRSIWTRGKTAGGKRIHPTQKPEWLLERIISATSNTDHLVFDPFLGSGTTAAVAKRLGRSYLGAEIDKSFYKQACVRIQNTKICTI